MYPIHVSYTTITQYQFIIGEMSMIIGWAIQQGTCLTSSEGKEEIKSIKKSLRGIVAGRSQVNSTVLLFFVKKVSDLLANLHIYIHLFSA